MADAPSCSLPEASTHMHVEACYRAGLADAAHELEQLRRWKAEAMPLFDGLQDLGRALGLPLGVLVTGPVAVAAAKDLRSAADEALRQHREDWASYIENWSAAVGPTPPTVESLIVALRRPSPPFGVAAADSTEGGADRG